MTVGLYNKYAARFSEILYRGLLPGHRPSQEDGLQTYAIVLEACRNVLYRKGPNRLEEDELEGLVLGAGDKFTVYNGYLATKIAPVRVLDRIKMDGNETLGHRTREIVAKARKAAIAGSAQEEIRDELNKEWEWWEGKRVEITREGAQPGRRK